MISPIRIEIETTEYVRTGHETSSSGAPMTVTGSLFGTGGHVPRAMHAVSRSSIVVGAA